MKMKSMIIALFTFGALFAIDAPENLQAVGGDGQIDLNWDAVDGAASYNVYQVVEDGGGTGDNGGGCEFDWTAYGAADCDAAWDEFGIDCATLEGTYFWDCAGCACVGDVPCEDQGLITCSDGSCAASEADCPQMLTDCSGVEFGEAYLAWIGDGYCDDGTDQGWTPILDFMCEEYDFDGGDCDGRSIAHNGSKILSIAIVDSPIALPGTVLNDGTTFTASNTSTRESYVYLGSVEGTEASITGFNDGDEGCFVVTADDGETGGVGDSCGEGVMLDCWLQCVDEATLLAWIGDGWCDDNTYGMYLDCPEFECDGGDCPELNCDGGDGPPLSCEEQGLVTCVDGSCAATEADCPASSADCEACEFDWTAYGAECCDAAYADFGIDCATLEGTYGWDCAGCACPGDVACEDQGLITCSDGTCAVSEADCPQMMTDCSGTEFSEEYLAWIGDGYCDSGDGSWDPNLDFNCEDYDFDGGDCASCEEQGLITCGD
ncbi:MAG: hypothetical protein H8E72_09655, partial [Candidatus Marinimicrobia bacterium]|nr:hypothetical protein [Candidatus Neomarinimicrobiota bacterium]